MMDELSALKSILSVQDRINQLRIHIWQIAARKYFSADAIIQDLLDLIGSFFNVTYASYYIIDENMDAYCRIQWKAEDASPTIGTTIPGKVFSMFRDNDHVLLNEQNIPENVRPDILRIFNERNVFSFLGIPYHILGKLCGFFNFSDKNPGRVWNSFEIEILKEVSKIISIKVMEINAEKALMQLTERLEKKVGEHTLKLEKANEDLKEDIRRRKKAEKALRESEELYKTLIYTSPNPIIITDLGFTITLVNTSALELNNLTDSDLIIGKKLADFISPESRKMVTEKMNDILGTGGRVCGEFIFLKYDGTFFPGELHVSLIRDAEKKPVAFLSVIIDLTERKKTEEALEKEKELFEVTLKSINDAVVTINKKGMIVFINKKAESLIGCSYNDAIGKDYDSLFAFIDKDNNEYHTVLINDLFESRKSADIFTDMFLVSCKKKERLLVAGSCALLKTRTKNIIGAVLVFRDISRQKALEDEFFRAKNMESIGILAGGLAHDFNNILTGIITNISLANTLIRDSDEVRELINNTEKAALRASRLTNQLLTFSKGGTPVKESASIKKMIIESANFCLSGAKIKCEFDLPAELWAVEVDRGQVYQVLNNIILNAKDAMPDGGRLILRAENTEITGKENHETGNLLKPGKYIKVSITDEGCGIIPENLEKIFDPYFTTKETGTGLGLTSVYSIIRKHGGIIRAESEIGTGTTFRFYLPATGTPPEIEESSTTNDFHGSGRILIMDDDEDVRKVVVRLLDKVGYTVTATVEGKGAVCAYMEAAEKNNRFDLVIMDLTVRGGMQGLDAVHAILSYDPDARIVVSSGYSNAQIMANYKDFGIKAVIAKPFTIDAFLELVKEMCGK